MELASHIINSPAFLDAIPDALVIVNKDGRIVLVNQQTENLFGYTRSELIGELVECLIPPRFRDNHPDFRNSYFANPQLRSMGRGVELYGLKKGGTEFPVDINLSSLKTEEGYLVMAAVRDLSARIKIEDSKSLRELEYFFTELKGVVKQLRARNSELRQAISAKDRFLAGMSHELRTPLNAIIGFTGTLLLKLPGPLTAEQEKQLRTVETSSKHLLSIINDILDLAKIDSGKVELIFEKVNLEEIIKDIEAVLTPLAKAKKIDFKVNLVKKNINLITAKRALTQLLINLSSNAIKYTEKGSVEIKVYLKKIQKKDFVVFDIIDTGIGIKSEDQDKIFKAFKRIESDKELGYPEGSSGLGLYLSKKLVHLIKGKIEFQSEYGKGSCFSILLPTQPSP